MASTKRNSPCKQEDVAASSKKAKETVSETETLPSPRVVLNPADCDLDFTIECDGVVGYGLNEEGFRYCWSGARANVGITGGKYCFGFKIVSEQHVVLDDIPRDMWHQCRFGVSRGDDVVGRLGDSKNSFCITRTGKISHHTGFLDFCKEFSVGDTIVCCINIESKPAGVMRFYKDGIWLGTSHRLDYADLFRLGGVNSPPGSLPWGQALFPHVLLKNIKVEMQFSVEDGLVPQEGFKPWALAVADGNAVMGPTLSQVTDCEVIMMVGFPASGKTTWARKCAKDHPEKRYILLGTDLILDKMKLPRQFRRNNGDDGVFDHWMDRATEIYNRMLSMAATIPRNYIIDQTNVYLNVRKRKLKPFADFQKIAVVVFPNPKELKIRSRQRFVEIAKTEPIDKLKDMIANFVLPKSKDMPSTNEYFDQVIFVELNREESQKYLDQARRDIAATSA